MVIAGDLVITINTVLRLQGSVSNAEPSERFNYLWTETTAVANLSSPLVSTGRSNRNLVIRPGLLQPRHTYVRISKTVLCINCFFFVFFSWVCVCCGFSIQFF